VVAQRGPDLVDRLERLVCRKLGQLRHDIVGRVQLVRSDDQSLPVAGQAAARDEPAEPAALLDLLVGHAGRGATLVVATTGLRLVLTGRLWTRPRTSCAISSSRRGPCFVLPRSMRQRVPRPSPDKRATRSV